MTYCRVCRKTLFERLANWRENHGPVGYEVVSKIGASSYKCVCNRCNHTWITKSKEAAFQFDEPEVCRQIQLLIEKNVKLIYRERDQGYRLKLYPKAGQRE